jgi:prophage antirepressor-like protein
MVKIEGHFSITTVESDKGSTQSYYIIIKHNKKRGKSMNNLQIFNYQGKQEIRTIEKSGEVWFITKDACDVLELNNVGQALTRLDEDEKNTIILNDGNRGNPNLSIINEPGLYSLILTSRKPEAKTFKRWITHEVIPSIRKTGSYSVNPSSVDEIKALYELMLPSLERAQAKPKELTKEVKL